MSEQDVLAAVVRILPAIRERAAETEARCCVPEATIKELTETGFFRLLQPRLHGGLGADPVVFLDCVRQLGRACGSTGWVAGVLGVNAWQLALFAPRAQEDVWGPDRDARICVSLAPVGQVTQLADGYRLSGRWSFSSGSDHADWAMVGAIVRDGQGKPLEMRTFLLPGSDYRVDRVWDTVGLRGTGSNDLIVEDVFVPAHRTLGASQIADRNRPGHAVNPEPVYRLPLGSLFTSSISAPIVGMAEAAYEAYLTAMRARVRASGGGPVAEDPFAQVRAGRAASEIDAAWLQLSRNIADLHDWAGRGEQPPMRLRTRLRRDQVLATERAVTAVDLLMENAGGGAMRTGDNVLQRAWRDVHTGRGHITNDPEKALVLFGREAFGLDVSDPML
ncbi:acyl-CoA dehydrogenase family protein [Streptomyces sp. W16]|uniref:3-hydroxy-9,10-secoandrosta-1,3,5(10)-triene-9, 17-dione monooxygenase oxygenase subunit n=1 Tax=Streptomyces sp. W16 TaxID=3076631 RepID=UPI00295BC77A|nr:3-hydroxy-9,10-secoandrosta-1,3,5(10)-triene-9,17-dione monooxygenase oxygenase subunit [Streptomyces sp. W16]MDV9170737.1 acyl-CoA dehydrogenase family protein [Streptomyces sp. W16]